jgi:hypothetical protein
MLDALPKKRSTTMSEVWAKKKVTAVRPYAETAQGSSRSAILEM